MDTVLEMVWHMSLRVSESDCIATERLGPEAALALRRKSTSTLCTIWSAVVRDDGYHLIINRVRTTPHHPQENQDLG